jgi:hypothetical protein
VQYTLSEHLNDPVRSDGALYHYAQAEAIFKKSGNYNELLNVYNFQADIYEMLGHNDQVEAYRKKAKDISLDIVELPVVANDQVRILETPDQIKPRYSPRVLANAAMNKLINMVVFVKP